jgi:hypothetical protein
MIRVHSKFCPLGFLIAGQPNSTKGLVLGVF